jgi:hypothetical protein
MHSEFNSPFAPWQVAPGICAELSAPIEKLIAGTRRHPDSSFTIPVRASQLVPCVFCLEPVFQARLACGEWYDATVERAEGELRADLLHPHRCPEEDRFQQFLDAPWDHEWGAAE